MTDEAVPDVVLAVINRLRANTAVAAIVGTRVYCKNLPPNPTYPAITVSEVDDIEDDNTSTSAYAHTRVQCSCFAGTDGPARALSKTVRKALHRTSITVPATGTTGGVYLVSIFDAGATPDENTDIPLYYYHRDFMIEYT